MRIDINYAIFSDRSETSSVLPKLLFQAAGRPDQAGPNPSLVVVIVAILLLILLFAGDHDRRWKWHRSVQKLLAGATAAGRGRPSPFSALIYFASCNLKELSSPSIFTGSSGGSLPWSDGPGVWVQKGEHGPAQEGN